MGRIEVLSAELVNHIAAGEVVERPMSIVKEMVENAIDANATAIEVQVSSDARSLIRIADNGHGMDESDLKKAFLNHATSKIRTVEDLFAIHSLGFRGEALASIAAVSKTTCSTRTADMDTGLRATVGHDGEVSVSPHGCSVGSIMEVRDLFFNLPARQKFLKQAKTELAHVEEMLHFLALSHPEIKFTLKIQDAVAFQTSGSGDSLQALQELFSVSPEKELLAFEQHDTEQGLSVKGWTSIPSVYRSSKKWIFPFINGRAIRCHILTKAIESAYQSAITPGKYPITILNLTLPTSDVDVNVHPTKKEVRYVAPNSIFSFVRAAIYNALSHIPTEQVGATHASSNLYSFAPRAHAASSPGDTHDTRNARNAYSNAYVSPTTAGTGLSQRALSPRAQAYTSAPQAHFQALSTEYEAPSNWRVIGQLARTYILLETPEGLLVVDQHIASERVQFERLSTIAQARETASQPLLVPLNFPLSPEQARQFETKTQQFNALGFQITLDANTLLIHAAPSLYNAQTLKETIIQLLNTPIEDEQLRLDTDDVIATLACHSAVRAGDLLNHEQMTVIIRDWYACQRPWTCPHGRPVTHEISHQSLMAKFDRPSLPAGIGV